MSQHIMTDDDSILSHYQQAQAIAQGVLTKRLILNDAVFPHWIEGSDFFWYLRETRAGKEYRLVNPKEASNQPAFDHQALADALAKASAQTVDPENLPISTLKIQLSPTTVIEFTAFDKHWRYTTGKTACEAIKLNSDAGLLSPDGKKAAFAHDNNLWVRDLTNGKEWALTRDGTADNYYAGDCSGSPPLQAMWSPDSQRLLTHQLDKRSVETTPFIHHVPVDESPRPQLVEYKIAHPGDVQVETYRLTVVDVETGQVQDANYRPLPQYSSSGFFTRDGLGWWASDSRRAFFIDVARGAKTVRVVELDTYSGTTRMLFEEVSSTFVKLSHALPERPVFLPLPDSDELIWFSERSGWAQLYLYDLNTGLLKHPIIGKKASTNDNKEWLIRSILHFDAALRELLIQTAARDPDISPYYRDICKLNIDTGELTPLTKGQFDHAVFEPDSTQVILRSWLGTDGLDVRGVSPSGNYLVSTRSRVDMLPISLLIDREGGEVLTLETADPVGLPEDWQWPEPIKLKSADGHTDLYGVVYRPPGFSPEKHYPIVDFSCAYPAYSYVPHAAFTSGVYCGEPYLMGAAYAALGFIVVALEVPGMSYRHKAFQERSYGRMASANAFNDRIAGIHQLAKRYPYMDLDRVGLVGCDGINGPVYGLLEYPEFYKVGVMVAFQDSRFEPASIAEMYEGVSQQQTNGCYAEDLVSSLQGKLLLIHGMLDTVTPPENTFRLVEALRQANKDFDLLLLPNDGHEISSYTLRRTWDYLLKHLQGIEPPETFKLTTAWDLLLETG